MDLDFVDFNREDVQTANVRYEAAKLQREQFNSANIAEHFIHRKAGNTIGIKRTCGVSYVKKTESKQLNVKNDYDLLPHLVI